MASQEPSGILLDGFSPGDLERMFKHFRERAMLDPRHLAYKYKAHPYETRIRAAMQRACEQLPLRLAHKISEIRFGPDGVTNPRFEVVYMGGKVIEFDDVDNFPSDADIARIALECP
jgi:hypothetical protein